MDRNKNTTPRILIVEEDSIQAAGLGRSLTSLGYEVAGVASSGTEAVEMARALSPDLVIMNILLDYQVRGLRAAELIKLDLDIPVVWVTGCAEKDIVEHTALRESYGFLILPVLEPHLKAAVSTALLRHQDTLHGGCTRAPVSVG